MRLLKFNRRAQLGVVGAVLATAGFPCCGQAIADLPACEAKSPTIDGTAVKEVTMAGVALEAQINPQGNETSYKFAIVWRAVKPLEEGERMPPGSPSQEGRIAAGWSDTAVSAFLTGLEPGYTYWYEVVATSLGNNTRSVGPAVSYYNPDWYKTGYAEGPPYIPSQRAGCANESGNLAAEETVRKQRELEAKQAEEASRRQRTAEHPQPIPPVSVCKVPDLKGKSLTAAHRAIDRAHCRLGRVTRPYRRAGKLIVTRQNPHPGASLRKGAFVGIVLGPVPTRRSR